MAENFRERVLRRGSEANSVCINRLRDRTNKSPAFVVQTTTGESRNKTPSDSKTCERLPGFSNPKKLTSGPSFVRTCFVPSTSPEPMFESLQLIGISTAVVTAAEIGDKTQLLAFFLAARFRAPMPICLGILAATVANHAIAGLLGASVASFIDPEVLRWILVAAFLAMAVWILIPDKMEEDSCVFAHKRFGVFGTTCVLFFLAEMGDKTQIATMALGASYATSVISVVTGTTLGMLLADVPAVFIGNKLSEKLSMKWMRRIAAAIFVLLAVLAAVADAPDV